MAYLILLQTADGALERSLTLYYDLILQLFRYMISSLLELSQRVVLSSKMT